MTRALRGLGWTLVVVGSIVLLYVVYLMWFTDLSANASQRELAESWEAQLPQADAGAGSEAPVVGDASHDDADDTDAASAPLPEPGEAFAALWFERDGQHVVTGDTLYVVEGVSSEALRRGPGHYPDSDVPGGAGNLAIAGHRTTYGRPFWGLGELQEGDTIHVVDRAGREWVYAYREQRVVEPSDVWVVGDDPLGTGTPTITLTTCHPRFSAAERLIAWGELVGPPRQS